MDLAAELLKQKDRLEAADRVTVEPQDLISRANGHAYQGSVDIYATPEREKLHTSLDLYAQDGSFKIDAHEPNGDWSDSFRRYTVPDVLLLVSSLIHQITSSRSVELEKEHWPSCRLVVTREHLTARRERFSSTVTFRGDYFECLEELRESVSSEGPPTDLDFDIKGDIPPEHTVEEPPSDNDPTLQDQAREWPPSSVSSSGETTMPPSSQKARDHGEWTDPHSTRESDGHPTFPVTENPPRGLGMKDAPDRLTSDE
jgi:hypothetical protein